MLHGSKVHYTERLPKLQFSFIDIFTPASIAVYNISHNGVLTSGTASSVSKVGTVTSTSTISLLDWPWPLDA